MKNMSGKIPLGPIGLIFYLLFGYVTLVQANGKGINTVNKEDIDTLLHRLHSFPGHLKWNLFHPIQSRPSNEFPTDMNFSKSTRLRKESFSHETQHGRLMSAEPFILDHKQINDVGKADISQDAQIKVPTNLLIALLEILAERKQRQKLVSETSQHGTLTDIIKPLNGDLPLSGQSKLNMAGHPKNELRNDNWIQNEMKASGHNELFSESQLKIPTHVLIAEIEKLLKTKQKGDDTTPELSENSNIKERLHISVPSQPRSVRRMEPIILKPVEIGHNAPFESTITNPTYKLNLSRPVLKESKSILNRKISLSPVKPNLSRKNQNRNTLKHHRKASPAEQTRELSTEVQLDASVRGDLTIQGQIEVPTKLLLNAKNTYNPDSQNNFGNLRVHDNRFHTNGIKQRDNTIPIQPNNEDQRFGINKSHKNQFDLSGTVDVTVEGQIEVPKHVLDISKKSLHDLAAQTMDKQTDLSNNRNAASDLRKQLLQHIQGKGSNEIHLDSTDSDSNTTKGQVEIQSLSPDASLRTIYSAPGLGKIYNAPSGAFNISHSKQFGVDSLLQSPSTEKQISNKVNIDSTGRGEFILEGQIEVPTHLLRNAHDKLFVALGRAKKEPLPSKRLPIQRQKQNAFNNPEIVIPKYLVGRSNPELYRKSQLYEQNQEYKVGRALHRPGYNHRGISSQTNLGLSGTTDVAIEGQVEVPSQFLESPESTFTSFKQPTSLHNGFGDTIRANTKSNTGFNKSLGPGRIDNIRQRQLDATGGPDIRTDGEIKGLSRSVHLAHINKNIVAKKRKLPAFAGNRHTVHPKHEDLLGKTHLDASGGGNFVVEGQIEIPSNLLHNSRGKLNSILSKTRQKQSWVNSGKRKENINNKSLLQNSNQYYLDAAGNADVTIEGQVEIPNRLVETPGSILKDQRQRSNMPDVQSDTIVPRIQSINSLGKSLHQGQAGIVRQMQLDSQGSADVTLEGQIQIPSRYTHMENTNKHNIAKNNLLQGVSGKRRPFNQGYENIVRQTQLDASGTGDIVIEGQIELPSSLLSDNKRNRILSLGNRDQNHYSRKSVEPRQNINSNIQLQDSNKLHLHASGMGDFTIEGQIEIPTSNLENSDSTKLPRNQLFNVHNREYRDKNGHTFRRFPVTELIKCHTDPKRGGLSCEFNELRQHCKEKWNFPNPCTIDGLISQTRKYRHPRDKTKFLSCTETGKFYIVQCPQHEVFHTGCGVCAEKRYNHIFECHKLPNTMQAPKFLDGIKVGHVTSPEITEASGICASRRHKHVLYTHNDSGDTHRIFAIDGRTGRTLAIININGTFHQDWEDIACGPCEGGSDHCVYIADTGGNAGGLSNTIYRIREPASITDQTVPLDSSLAFSWDQKDCETVMVDPRGDVYVISKVDDGRGKFVLLPSSAWGRTNRTYVQDGVYLKISSKRDNPTGGDISPDGTEILLKTYNGVYYWNITDGNYSAGIVKPPKILPYIQERQGEGVCWDSRGFGYYTLGEGLNSTLYYYQRSGQPGFQDD